MTRTAWASPHPAKKILYRYALAGGLLGLFIVILLAKISADRLQTEILHVGEQWATAHARQLRLQIDHDFFEPAVERWGEVDLEDPVQYALLDEVVRRHIEGLDIHAVVLFDAQGAILYSTQASRVGYVVRTENLTRALAGEVRTELLPAGTLDHQGRPWPYGVVECYWPARGRVGAERTGAVEGVVEVYQGTGLLAERLAALRQALLFMVLAAIFILGVVSWLMLRSASRALDASFRELEETREETVRLEKLSALGELLAGFAHELNNPLGAIVGLAEVMEKDGGLSEVHREDLAIIQDQGLRARDVVQGLLRFARKEPPSRKPLLLNEEVRQASLLLEYQCRVRGVVVDLDLAKDLPEIQGDPQQLLQVFVAIITNAIQAMEKGGTIYVRTERTARGARVSFRNTGPAIPPEVLPRVFDPFYTTKPVGKGTGLGLSMAYGIVQAHGGEIHAGNHPDGGPVFSIELPLGQDPQSQGEPGLRPGAHAHALAGSRILVVDDEPAYVQIASRVLTRAGCTVDGFDGAVQALNALQATHYDLLLSDLRMPGMAGTDLIGEAKSLCPWLQGRVVCMTGNVLDPESMSFLQEHGIPFVEKPFEAERLLVILAEVLAAGERR